MNLILQILRNLRLDAISFWLGFLAGLLVTLFLRLLRAPLARLREAVIAQRTESEIERNLVFEIRLGNDTLRQAQTWHLAAPLFSLDEIVQPSRLLAPPAPPAAYGEQPPQDITDWAIPYLPEWPEMGSYYGAPTLSLAEALSGGNPIAIIGQPGSGKTVALAHLAIQMVRHDPAVGELGHKVPLLLHVSELMLSSDAAEDPLPILTEAVSHYAHSIKTKRLAKLIHDLLQQKRLVLLLDGLDELAPAQVAEIAGYLHRLREAYPGLQIAAAAAPECQNGLAAAGFAALPMAAWSKEIRQAFILRWGELWEQFIAPGAKTSNPLILTGWLLNNTANLTPLELTLKVWAAYAGDTLGASTASAAEAYVRRMLYKRSPRSRTALEELALQMTLNMEPLAELSKAEGWLRGSVSRSEAPGALAMAPPEEGEEEQIEAPRQGKQKRVRISGALPDLFESGLVSERAGERVSIAHPFLTAYLAGNALLHSEALPNLLSQPDWSAKLGALQFLAAADPQATWLNEAIAVELGTDPLLRGLLQVGRWLRHATERHAWAVQTLRRLAGLISDQKLPFGLRTRLIAALAFSNNAGVSVLFRQMLQAPDPELRQLAALGCGVLRDSKAVSELAHLLENPSPALRSAALLALVAIEDKAGLETVAYALLHGDDSLRRLAAEALANHPEEGHPALQEASEVDQVATRRAAAFGLGRIRQPWAVQRLEQLRAEDAQWVVQDAAIQALENQHKPNPRIPRPLPSLPQTSWLITFAAERGMGVAPGQPAMELLYRSLKEGKDEERLAALYYLSRNPEEGAVLPVYQVYFALRGDVREAAVNTLWHLAAAGIELPPPIQYGLH